MGPNRQLITSLTVLGVFAILLIVDLVSGAALALDVVIAVGVVIAAAASYHFYRNDGA
jgi:6,7-dimethyl-8-ribityllumazine synthase